MEQRPCRLEGKVAIVTGAGSSGPGVGTGKATSILFAREGAKVLLIDRVAQHATETLTAIRGRGVRLQCSRPTLRRLRRVRPWLKRP
jgi:NAD(P)-dependent dehydrogenase (short-subunit alcohol dehydrogenase family)